MNAEPPTARFQMEHQPRRPGYACRYALCMIENYIINHEPYDWGQLLRPWADLLPPEFSLWFVTVFGDVILFRADGSIQILDIGGCNLRTIAQSREQFESNLNDDEFRNDVFSIPLVDKLTASKIVLGDGQCYAFKHPPILGGDYVPNNVVILDIPDFYRTYGLIHQDTNDVADGTRVSINTRETA